MPPPFKVPAPPGDDGFQVPEPGSDGFQVPEPQGGSFQAPEPADDGFMVPPPPPPSAFTSTASRPLRGKMIQPGHEPRAEDYSLAVRRAQSSANPRPPQPETRVIVPREVGGEQRVLDSARSIVKLADRGLSRTLIENHLRTLKMGEHDKMTRFSPEKLREIKTFERAAKMLGDMAGFVRILETDLKDHPESLQLAQRLKAAMSRERDEADTIGLGAGRFNKERPGWEIPFEALDVLAKATRLSLSDGEAMNSEEWARYVGREAEAGSLPAVLLTKLALATGGSVGLGVGLGAGLVGQGAGMLSGRVESPELDRVVGAGIMHGLPGVVAELNRKMKDGDGMSLAEIHKTMLSFGEQGRDLMINVYADPLTYLTFGMSGGARLAGGVASSLKGAGVSDDIIRQVIPKLEQAIQMRKTIPTPGAAQLPRVTGGVHNVGARMYPEGYGRALEVMKGAAPAAPVDDTLRVAAGMKARMAAQNPLGPAMTSQSALSQARNLQRLKQAKKALAPLGEDGKALAQSKMRFMGKEFGPGVGSVQKQALHAAQLQARGIEGMNREAGKRAFDPVAEHLDPNAARQDAITKTVRDPDYARFHPEEGANLKAGVSVRIGDAGEVGKVVSVGERMSPVRFADGAVLRYPNSDLKSASPFRMGEEQIVRVAPETQLSLQEKVGEAGMDAWFEGRRKAMNEYGVMEPGRKAKNPLSGRYFPRDYDSVYSPLDEFASSKTAERSGPAEGFLNARGPDGGRPIGRANTPDGVGLKAETDPFKVVDNYNRKMARAVGAQSLEDFIVRSFGVPATGAHRHGKNMGWAVIGDTAIPADKYNAMKRVFGGREAPDTWLARAMPELRNNPSGRMILGGLRLYRELGNVFKRGMLSPAPAFHIINVTNDTTQLATLGIDPIANLGLSRKILKGKDVTVRLNTGAEISGSELLRQAKVRDLATSGLNRLDYQGFAGQSDAQGWRKVAQRSQKRSTGAYAGEAIADAGKSVYRAGDRLAEAWMNQAQLAGFVGLVKKGHAFDDAARLSLQAVIDYKGGAPGAGAGMRHASMQFLRTIMPFANWTFKAPGMVAKATLRSPGQVKAGYTFHKLGEAQAEGRDKTTGLPLDPSHTPRRYVSERGANYRLGEFGTQLALDSRGAFDRAANAVSETLGTSAGYLSGSPDWAQTPYDLPPQPADDVSTSAYRSPGVRDELPPGQQARFLTRSQWSEALAPFIALGGGNIDPLMNSLGPATKHFAEEMSDRDLLTKQDRSGLGGLLPFGLPGVPDWAKAQDGGLPASRYYPGMIPMVGSRPMQLHLNNAAAKNMGQHTGMYPVAGAARPYSLMRDERIAQGYQNLYTGWPWFTASAGDEMWNLLHTDEARGAQDGFRKLMRELQKAKLSEQIQQP